MDVTQSVQGAVNKLLLDEGMPALSQWMQILDILEKNGLAWKQQLPATLMMVHPQNRSGLGVNAHASHAKGANLFQSGFDSRYLRSSTCTLHIIGFA